MRRKSFEDGRKQFMSEAHLHNKSVIALALRHRSKMLIRYISQDALSASFVQKEQDSKQQTGEDVDKTIDKKPKRLGNAACADPKSAGPRIPKLHLQVNMGVQADDEDWIQVDDGDEIGETPRKPRESLLLTTNYLWESYRVCLNAARRTLRLKVQCAVYAEWYDLRERFPRRHWTSRDTNSPETKQHGGHAHARAIGALG
jgi:hypothetical protein